MTLNRRRTAPPKVEETSSRVPFYYKIDGFVCIFMVFIVWNVPNAFNLIRGSLLLVHIPPEALVHLPIFVNVSMTDVDHRVICNPHFRTFIDNSSFFTNEFKEHPLRKAKSEEFLALPEIQDYLEIFRNKSGRMAVFALEVTRVCEIDYPFIMSFRGCMSYDVILQRCLNNTCLHQDVNWCWFTAFRLIRLIILTSVFCTLTATSLMLFLLFDPPIARFRQISRPGLTAVFFLAASGLKVIFLILEQQFEKTYLSEPILTTAWNGQNGYTWGMSSGTTSAFQNIAYESISGVYFAIAAFFKPGYPRHQPRVNIRRQNFRKGLEKVTRKSV